jgi:hypothetical protein
MLSIGLPIFFIAVWSTLCVYAAHRGRFLKCEYSTTFGNFTGVLNQLMADEPIPDLMFPGCYAGEPSSALFVEWALVMGFETGMPSAPSVAP